MDKNSKIYIAGHRGMVGSAVERAFRRKGYGHLLCRTHTELDLCDPLQVKAFFDSETPEYVVLAAAKVGGIMANNTYPAEFLIQNLQIQNNVITEAWKHGVKKLCFLGSSCIYPAQAPQPIKEEYLLTGTLEPTNEAYALAKITGYKLCCYLTREYGFNTISLMPCNLYGTNDNYHPLHSHVFPAMIRRFTEAVRDGVREITLWGTGVPLREFLHVDDVADAVVYFMENHNDPRVINIGYGSDITIRELAEKIAAAAGYTGKISWDPSKPDGMYRKLMDSSRANELGWYPKITLDAGIERTVREFSASTDFREK
ncbi:MAG: GDP-L-fucose synthase [Lentisphaeria bacterium]|nr:GDP-L-fucose synthase [Lentisphaeria bacterium]